jgi:gamma-glutamyl phosphate reductase
MITVNHQMVLHCLFLLANFQTMLEGACSSSINHAHREAVESCKAIVTAIKDGLSGSKASPDVVALLTSREETAELMKMKQVCMYIHT